MEKSLALVLRTVEFSESSYIATLYTEEFGKITALAKGARRRKSAFESALDLLSLSRIVFIPKRSDVLDLLTEARLERRFRSASRDLSRLYAGLYLAETLDAFTDQGDACRELFAAASHTIQNLDEQGDIATWVAWFELRMLRLIGHLPELEFCVQCGRTLAAGRSASFGHTAGGVLCAGCKEGKRHLVRLEPAVLSELRRLAASQESQPPPPDLPPSLRGAVRGWMNGYLASLLGRRLRMTSWLRI
jgi:DNA repair protein RecO (recombination protein O)